MTNIYYLYYAFRVIQCLVTDTEYSVVVINLFHLCAFSNLNAKRSHRASLVQCFRNCQAIGLRLCFYFKVSTIAFPFVCNGLFVIVLLGF